MKAELFVHAESQHTVPTLRRLIAESIDPDLTLEVNSVDTGRIADNLKTGTRYSQLLQAAIPPELGLSLGVSWLSWLGERIYLQVYWPVITGASGQDYDPTIVPFFPNTFNYFFPALAIRDRMVLVPQGGGENLGTVYGVTRISSVLREDVLEIDYRNEEKLRSALDTVARGLSDQLQHELASWANFQPAGTFDLQMAARDLDIDVNLLRRILADRIQTITAPYKRLSCQLDKTRLTFGRWTRVVLTLTNSSDEAITGATVDITGPVDILPSKVEVDLPSGTIEVPLSMKPTDEGEFPIEITLVQTQDTPFKQWLPPLNLWLESSREGG